MIDINKVFIRSLIVSIIGTIVTTFFKQNPILIFAVGVLPLCYYFFELLRLSKDGLSQTTVDSIYYFGFIVTIGSLAASVLSVAIHGVDGDIKHLIAQFGVGLLATGLALVFRMILIAKLESLTQKDLSETIDDYVRKIDHVVSKVEASADSFESLSELLIERTKNTCELIHAEYQQSMLASGQVFQKELLGMLAKFSEESTASIKQITNASNEFYGLVQTIRLDAHVLDINNHAGQISAGLAKFAEDAKNFSRVTQEEVLSITRASVASSLDNLSLAFDLAAKRSADLLCATEAELQKVDFHDETESIKSELRALSRNINSYTKKILAKEEQVDFLVDEVASKTAMAIQVVMTQRGSEISSTLNQLVKDNVEAVKTVIIEGIQRDLPIVVNGIQTKVEDLFHQLDDELNSISKSLADANFNMVAQSLLDNFSDLSQQTEKLSILMGEIGDDVVKRSDITFGAKINESMQVISAAWQEQIQAVGSAMSTKVSEISAQLEGMSEGFDVHGMQSNVINFSREVKSAMHSLEAMKVALEEITFEARRSIESLIDVNEMAKLTIAEVNTDERSKKEVA